MSREFPGKRDDGGFTLVELLVTMMIMGIVFAALPVILSSTTKVAAANSTRLSAMNQARVSVESAARLLRTAVVPKQLGGSGDSAFILGDDYHVQFYADIDNPDNAIGPSRVTLSVTSGNLVQTVQPPDQPIVNHDYQWSACVVGSAGCTIRQTTLATNVATGSPVFTYYVPDVTGADRVLTGQQPYDATALGSVDSIEISVTVGKTAKMPIAADTYISRVTLLNKSSIVQGQGTGS